MKVLSKIYLHHTREIWKQPIVLEWLEATVHKILPSLESKNDELKHWTKKFVPEYYIY